MLFIEPINGFEKEFPPEIVGIIKVFTAIGFKGPVQNDLDRVNRGLSTPLVEKDGKFFCGDKVAGYQRYRDTDL